VSTCPTPVVVPDVPGTEISTIAETENDEDDEIILDYIEGLAELEDPPIINFEDDGDTQSIRSRWVRPGHFTLYWQISWPGRLFATTDAVIVLEDDYCIEDPGDWA
jgi:hypothetical protein